MANELLQPETPIKAEGNSTFNTRIPGWVEINSEDKGVLFGTAMFGDYFGQITRMDLGRAAAEVLVQGGWNQVIAYILSNYEYTLSLELIPNKDAKLPGPGDIITFPLAGVKGVVKPGAQMSASNTGATTFTIEASSWDSLDNNGAGTRTLQPPPASIASGGAVAEI